MRLICVLLSASGMLCAQSLVEHAVAAAGGSAAGVAGKQVSNGLDKVFQSVDRTVKTAETTSFKSKTKATNPHIVELTPPAPSAPDSLPPARSSGYSRAARRYAAPPARPVPLPTRVESFDGRAVSLIVAQVNLPTFTLADLAAVPPGTLREDLAPRIGRPTARVVIPDGGRLVEILSYSSRDGYLGNVKLTDGQVVEVRPASKR